MKRATHMLGRALRETGQALDRAGLTVSGKEIFRDTLSRHRQVMNLFDKRPIIAQGSFVAPNASVIGDVLLYDRTSVWYGAVLRGDKSKIKIGHNTNVQDRAVISTVSSLENGFSADVDIGDSVTIGHGALLTSCVIKDKVLIGQGAIVQEGSVIESNVILAAGSVVLPETMIPKGQLWAGNPAKYVRDVTEEEVAGFEKSAKSYATLAEEHLEEFLPFGTAHLEAEKLAK